jgi:hypothetical protein
MVTIRRIHEELKQGSSEHLGKRSSKFLKTTGLMNFLKSI